MTIKFTNEEKDCSDVVRKLKQPFEPSSGDMLWIYGAEPADKDGWTKYGDTWRKIVDTSKEDKP